MNEEKGKRSINRGRKKGKRRRNRRKGKKLKINIDERRIVNTITLIIKQNKKCKSTTASTFFLIKQTP